MLEDKNTFVSCVKATHPLKLFVYVSAFHDGTRFLASLSNNGLQHEIIKHQKHQKPTWQLDSNPVHQRNAVCNPCNALPKCPSQTLKVADCVAALASLPLRCASDLLTAAAQDQTVSTSSVSHCHIQSPKRHTHEACEFPVRAKSL